MENIKKENMIKKGKKKRYFSTIFEIVLLISVTIAISYILHESSKDDIILVSNHQKLSDRFLLGSLKVFDNLVFGNKGLVSALNSNDLIQGSYTCPLDKNGSICQEYVSSECKDNCAVDCLPSPAEQTSTCKPGTCYDPVRGGCQVGATQTKCEQTGGQWFNDPYGNIPQCKPGCCILGNNVLFGTKQQCDNNAAVLGIKSDFKSDVNTEIACIMLSKTQVQGACVIQSQDGTNTCKFTNQPNCITNLGGNFFANLLCSNPQLKTSCIAQQSINCLDGKDQIFWFDSCGNPENIFQGASQPDRIKSLNTGKVLDLNSSCNVFSGNNLLSNQATCGNCNYLLGTKCGAKTSTQQLSGINADVVCRDLSCTDQNGNKRMNGESWCLYQGSIGTDKGAGGFLRASDTVGSRNFRQSCIDGQIQTDPCADYRNEICVQSNSIVATGTISSAACRINRGYTCYDVNQESDPKKRTNLCQSNPDCFIKHVEVTNNFKFDICLPKYTPGFDFTQREASANICSMATQKCEAVFVKGITGWKCESNCGCVNGNNPNSATPSQKFAEQMNDFCSSLGDCGTKANYLGSLSVNSNIYRSTDSGNLGSLSIPRSGLFSTQYTDSLVKYANDNIFKGKYIDAGDISKFYGQLGIPGTLGGGSITDKSGAVLGMAEMTSGVMGVAFLVASYGAAHGVVVPLIAHGASWADAADTVTPNIGAGLSAIGGVIAGAAIGLGIVSMLIKLTGIGRGLPPGIVYSLLIAGAVAGALIGGYITIVGTIGLFSATVPIIGWIIAAIVLIVILIFKLLGVGKVKNVYYTFQCNAWQAPTGGDKCGKCGSDGLSCSAYSCSSLGQNCQLINEGTPNSECVNISPNDTQPPTISPMGQFLPAGYSMEQNSNGVKIKTSGSDGCIIDAYSSIPFGISLDESGQCTASFDRSNSSNDLINGQALSGGLFVRNHSIPLTVPSLSSLGLESFDPNVKADMNIYIQCQDKSGNKNINLYDISYCIKPGNDTTPPAVVDQIPEINLIPYGTTLINASVITNEPSNCNWDTIDTGYELMKNNFSCANDFEQRVYRPSGVSGWKCDTNLPILNNQSTFYVRCLDQPWLIGENYTKRNADTQSYIMNLSQSAPLSIDKINVDNQNFTFGQPGSISVVVDTSGGYDGTADCAYLWGNTTIDFFDTWKSESTQVFQGLNSGDIYLPIVCKDLIGNVASKTAHFTISIDTTPPSITRLYQIQNILNVVTNKPSTCYYSTDVGQQCLYNLNNGSLMGGQNTLLHTSIDSVKFGTTYYIKCNDTVGNYNSDCGIIAKGG